MDTMDVLTVYNGVRTEGNLTEIIQTNILDSNIHCNLLK